MRKPSALFARNSRPQSQFSIRELLLWMVILSLLFASCGYSSSGTPLTWTRALWIFSPAIKLLAAVIATLLLEVVAVGLAARVQWPSSPRDLRASRRFWYRSNRRDFGELAGGPVLPIVVYLNVFLAYRMMVLASVLWPQLQPFFLTPNAAGVSYWLMFRLISAAFLGYLAAHLVCGLLPMTLSSRRERFLLVLATILIATSCYATP